MKFPVVRPISLAFSPHLLDYRAGVRPRLLGTRIDLPAELPLWEHEAFVDTLSVVVGLPVIGGDAHSERPHILVASGESGAEDDAVREDCIIVTSHPRLKRRLDLPGAMRLIVDVIIEELGRGGWEDAASVVHDYADTPGTALTFLSEVPSARAGVDPFADRVELVLSRLLRGLAPAVRAWLVAAALDPQAPLRLVPDEHRRFGLELAKRRGFESGLLRELSEGSEPPDLRPSFRALRDERLRSRAADIGETVGGLELILRLVSTLKKNSLFDPPRAYGHAPRGLEPFTVSPLYRVGNEDALQRVTSAIEPGGVDRIRWVSIVGEEAMPVAALAAQSVSERFDRVLWLDARADPDAAFARLFLAVGILAGHGQMNPETAAIALDRLSRENTLLIVEVDGSRATGLSWERWLPQGAGHLRGIVVGHHAELDATRVQAPTAPAWALKIREETSTPVPDEAWAELARLRDGDQRVARDFDGTLFHAGLVHVADWDKARAASEGFYPRASIGHVMRLGHMARDPRELWIFPDWYQRPELLAELITSLPEYAAIPDPLGKLVQAIQWPSIVVGGVSPSIPLQYSPWFPSPRSFDNERITGEPVTDAETCIRGPLGLYATEIDVALKTRLDDLEPAARAYRTLLRAELRLRLLLFDPGGALALLDSIHGKGFLMRARLARVRAEALWLLGDATGAKAALPNSTTSERLPLDEVYADDQRVDLAPLPIEWLRWETLRARGLRLLAERDRVGLAVLLRTVGKGSDCAHRFIRRVSWALGVLRGEPSEDFHELVDGVAVGDKDVASFEVSWAAATLEELEQLEKRVGRRSEYDGFNLRRTALSRAAETSTTE